MKRTVQVISFAIGAAVLSGCATFPETTRSAVGVQVPQATSISALQLQFEADTPHVVNFGFDEDSLDAEALAKLDQQASWILSHPNIKFRVHGHTDRVGNIAYNQALGLRRATRVVGYLIGQGIEAERLEAVVSFGEELPMVDTEDRERQNRRTVTEVYEYITLPTLEEVPEGGLITAVVTTDDTASEPTPVSDNDTPTPSDQPSASGDDSPSDDDTPAGDDTPSGNNTPSDDTSSTNDDSSSKTKSNNSHSKSSNSGRGNGDETGDPGRSEGKNKGGDI